ncbi:hypothetical protein PFICI_11328 [Pestalotiopsis fici W106-1]|uniref:KOW domain-containing protein n=1 Tax=Pestalotiopsis fici (strain W106-1 / CGMCC3.15140) TaxID=1229662 RepID=W3WUG9_PESFW|nr:uncharacterized protein PFICI_11328 [Pestalotiopsis fici W106-1]ETS77454.1 hypothetical protein PFICI_11328 [Pestalotiopsis fici W106-1]
MQKILKRVATAERVVAKRKAGRDRQAWNKERFSERDEVKYQRAQLAEDYGRAKQAIKDDWNLGANAPNVNIGERSGVHGAISEARYQTSMNLKDYQKEARCAWLGGAKNLNLVEGDRVVLLEGPDKGQIGKITNLQKEKMEVIVEGLNKSNVRMPIALLGEGKPPAINIELPIPISAVRLVHPIRDPKTNETKDVIINQLRHSNFMLDKVTGMSQWDRVVPGLNVTIPWPERQEKEAVDHKIDTLRIDVEERTFVPTLLRPPMPEVVLDELRNKYSRFRTRHEPEYIAAREAAEQAEKDRVYLMDSMRTPLQELHRATRDSKKKKGKPRLTAEMLEQIGRVIAKNRERTLNAAGVSDIAATAPSASSIPPESSAEAPTQPPSS